MSYISGSFKTPVLLPNGKEATSCQEVDAYLKEAGLAMASDYSKSFFDAQKETYGSSVSRIVPT